MKNKPRGLDLDQRLKSILEEMLQNGHKLSPITRSTVQRRLRLKSRSTLVGTRAQLIDQARITQLHEAGLTPDKKKRRNTYEEQIFKLRQQLKQVEGERDSLIERLAMIVNGLQAKGLDVEKLMLPLRMNYNKQKR